ncbi:hydrolase [Undibacterium jejuense]|uniref:Hydrolase n=1 Tax=Undibacterium jejuense TaxID=1344949 RepID=A0A923KKJ6_9BURK|nr:hydrolase [Undibacterium jejuense]MBC3861990.1 hydrolase [Undibacterium jejuense]
MLELNPKSTALILIDLQNGITALPLAPRSGAEICAISERLAAQCRTAGATVVLVNVGWAADGGDVLKQMVDVPMARPAGGLSADWSDLVPGLAQPGDLHVTKHQWGAFYGTDLDLQLRRRGIDTIILGGIATNFGVESTARAAWEHGYQTIVLEDACSSMSEELHRMSTQHILPRISRVRSCADIHFLTSTD